MITNDLVKWLRARQPQATIRIFYYVQWLIGSRSKELILPLSVFKHLQRWDAKDLHYQCKLLHFGLAWEDWNTSVKLNQDAAETPHIDTGRIWDANNDLWSSIEARLDVRVDSLVRETGGAEINDFDT